LLTREPVEEKAVFGKSRAVELAGALLMRGVKTKNKQQIQDETDRPEGADEPEWRDKQRFGERAHGGGESARCTALTRELLRESTCTNSLNQAQCMSPAAMARLVSWEPDLHAQMLLGAWHAAPAPAVALEYPWQSFSFMRSNGI
jgi:hypothetical protein